MKAAFELVQIREGSSVRIYNRVISRIPFELHHHPEYELTLTMNSCGKRYIGDAIDEYGENDVVLVPPDLPHTWASNRSIVKGEPQIAIVVWFESDWARRVTSCCPEFENILRLMRRARCALAFTSSTGEMLRGRVADLLSESPQRRLATVLEVLCLLADEEATCLASPGSLRRPEDGRPSQAERMDRILATIDARFAEPLSLEELAQAASLSTRSLNRYFEQHVGESVGKYLARIRIGHACRLLAETRLPIAVVAMRSGYPSVANFNRQFRSMKAMTPLAFRSEYWAKGPPPDPENLETRSPSLERIRRPTLEAD